MVDTATSRMAVKKKATNKTMRPTKKALELVSMTSRADVAGSYTGNPVRKGEKPSQDADDL